tara:strand:+ start:47 stop:616 length:570 start_codon:yes stop_codon:yes gene_type:complete
MGSMEMKDSVPGGFVEDLDSVYTAYLDAQERLADDDLSGYLDAAMQLDRSVESVRVVGLVGESLGTWRRVASKLSQESPATTMDAARLNFERMSEAIMELQDRFGNAADETIYTAYCPMAFDFKGAKWIQRGQEINNPYFGSEMLRCGDIEKAHEPLVSQDHDSMDMSIDPVMEMNMPDAAEHEGHDHD